MRSRDPIFAALMAALVAAAHSAQADTQFAADLPFRDCDGLICMDASLDGAAPRTLMLDTGNAHSTLITDVAKELSWTLQPAQRNGTTVPGIYIGGEHRVALGGIEASTTFYVFDRNLLGEYKPAVDGSITYDFFKDRVLEIDYPHHRLRVSNVIATPLPDKPPTSGTLRLVTFGEHGPPVVIGAPFIVNGKTVHAQIDTVFTGTMLIYDSALATLGFEKQGAPELFRYTDGGVNLLASHADRIGFGRRALLGGSPPLYFVGDGKNPVHQPDGLFEATVGNALFANSVVTLDFHAMTLDVRPAAN
ncbi:MAG TPA: hypothetical protein VGO25_13480 [Rhodanobacteraceae bacterium]|nr:hypothetical protein [Rhodanobacteraceae bacterium]